MKTVSHTHDILVDGSMGEGGGQVLRASLALSMALGKPFAMQRIRANRPKPGMKRQHLACVQAAQAVCGAEVKGAVINGTELVFAPGPVRAGDYRFDIGSGGSVTLVMQAVFPPLLLADGPSRLTVTGGTHIPHAPPFEFMAQTLFPSLERFGPKLSAHMDRVGFMQVGGGSVTATIDPVDRLAVTVFDETQPARAECACIYAVHIPEEVAAREREELIASRHARLGLREKGVRVLREGDFTSLPEGSGNAVLITLRSGVTDTVVAEIGWRGRAAETVARHAVKRALVLMASGAPVERHLADQLLVPMALAGGGSLVTENLTPHARTCLDVIGLFTGLESRITNLDSRAVRVDLF